MAALDRSPGQQTRILEHNRDLMISRGYTARSTPLKTFGSPNMEGHYPVESYQALSFDAEGTAQVFAQH